MLKDEFTNMTYHREALLVNLSERKIMTTLRLRQPHVEMGAPPNKKRKLWGRCVQYRGEELDLEPYPKGATVCALLDEMRVTEPNVVVIDTFNRLVSFDMMRRTCSRLWNIINNQMV